MKTIQTDVVIVGAGPVGLLLAHLLGQGGVRALLLERDVELSDEPRAVGLDPESLRAFQGLDLMPVLEKDLLSGLTGGYYNGEGTLLFEITDEERGPLGYTQLTGFNQPALVRTLARELDRYEEAVPLLERAIAIYREVYEAVPGDLAYPLHALAVIRREQGLYKESEVLFQEALELRLEHAAGTKELLDTEREFGILRGLLRRGEA